MTLAQKLYETFTAHARQVEEATNAALRTVFGAWADMTPDQRGPWAAMAGCARRELPIPQDSVDPAVNYGRDSVGVELWYPRNEETRCKAVDIALIDVRAAADIRVTYDFERDGWVIAQLDDENDGWTWREVAFVDAWALEEKEPAVSPFPIPMVLICPSCHFQHVDAPDPATGWTNPPHRSHLCAACGTVWRPADVPTVGVERVNTKGEKDTWAP